MKTGKKSVITYKLTFNLKANVHSKILGSGKNVEEDGM